METRQISLALRLCGLIVAALALATGLFGSQVLAGSAVVSVGSLTLPAGEDGLVELQATGIPDLIASWTIDISYDPEAVSVAECSPREDSVCDPQHSDDTIRVRGVSTEGLADEFTLATIMFRCGPDAGVSPLSLTIEIWDSASIPEVSPVQPDTQDGAITCVEPPEPTATPVPALPDTGTGGSLRGSSLTWLAAALAGAGGAAVAALGVLRLRTRRA